MANLLGYYSGVKTGQDARTDIEAKRSQMSLQAMQARGLEEDIRTKQAEEARRIKQQQTLESIANSQVPINLKDSYANNLKQQASNMSVMGKKLLALDPKAGMDMIKTSIDSLKEASNTSKDALELKTKQMEYAGTVSSQIFDQDSLDNGIEELSSVGVVVPEKYKKWSPETQEWLGRRAQASSTYLKNVRSQQEADKIVLDRQDTESKIAERSAKVENMKAKEERAREKVTSARKTFKPSKAMDKFVKEQANLLAELDVDADNWDSEIRKAAATDVVTLAEDLVQKNPTLTQDEAYKQARTTVLGNKDDKGNYKLIAPKATGTPDDIQAIMDKYSKK